MKRESAILEIEKLFEEVHKIHELEINQNIYSATSRGEFMCEFDSAKSDVVNYIMEKYGEVFLQRFFEYLGFGFSIGYITEFGSRRNTYYVSW